MELNHKSFKTLIKILNSQIGELILKNLRKENEVAYIRYALEEKFNGVKDFISTLESQREVRKPLASIYKIQHLKV